MKSRKKKWRIERKMGEEEGRGKGRAVHLQKWVLWERRGRRKGGGTNEGVGWGLYFYEWGEKKPQKQRGKMRRKRREKR